MGVVCRPGLCLLCQYHPPPVLCRCFNPAANLPQPSWHQCCPGLRDIPTGVSQVQGGETAPGWRLTRERGGEETPGPPQTPCTLPCTHWTHTHPMSPTVHPQMPHTPCTLPCTHWTHTHPMNPVMHPLDPPTHTLLAPSPAPPGPYLYVHSCVCVWSCVPGAVCLDQPAWVGAHSEKLPGPTYPPHTHQTSP